MRFLLYSLVLIIAAISAGACGTIHAFPPQSRDDLFELTEVDGFDAVEFRNRLAKLPADAGWADHVRRNEYVIESLYAAGWPGMAKELNYDATTLHTQIAQALYDAANRPGWRHDRYQEATVGALSQDLSRLCGIEEHIWVGLIAPLLDVPRKSREYQTAMGIVRASRLAEKGSGYRGLSHFVRSAPGGGNRDLFRPEYYPLLHLLYIESPVSITLELYSLYPSEGRELPERWELLWELSSIYSQRAVRRRQLFREEGPHAAEALREAPYPPRLLEIVATFAEKGGKPGQALALDYYGRDGSHLTYEPRLRDALIASDSEYARHRLRTLAAGLRKAVPDLESKIAGIKANPAYGAEMEGRLIEAARTVIREADAIDAAIGRQEP